MKTANPTPKSRLAEIAADAMSHEFESGIDPSDIEVTDYDADYDIIFINFRAEVDDTMYGYAAVAIRQDPYVIDVKHGQVLVPESKCNPCGRHFVPSPSAIRREHDCNVQSYGTFHTVADTLNTISWCSRCSGDVDPDERTTSL